RTDWRSVVDDCQARAVLVTGDQVDALLLGRLGVARAGRVGVDQRAVAPPVLGRCIGGEDARHAAELTLVVEHTIGPVGERVRLALGGEREAATKGTAIRLRGLGEAMVELAAASAGHVWDESVEGWSAGLVQV